MKNDTGRLARTGRPTCERPPSMVVVVELDAPVRAYIDALSAEDEAQLVSWIRANKSLCAALHELGVAA